MKEFQGLCLSSFNIATFVQLLNNDGDAPVVRAEAGEFGQWFVLPGKDDQPLDFLVVWTLPEHISPAFKRLLQLEPAGREELLRDVDDFCQAVLKMSGRAPLMFVPLWTVPPQNRGLGALDLKAENGVGRALLEMNARLCANLADTKGILPLNATRWMEGAGKRAFQPKSWYMTKNPFGADVYVEALRDVKAALAGSVGKAKKLVVVDLDDTMWGGIVGEVGWQGLRLGGHDYIGESYQDFQRALKALKNRGVLLAIASKNEERVALEAIQRHPEMVLKLEDFVGWRINWNDKAQNIVDLVKSLNLGLDSVVFLDDSEFERQRVRSAVPEIFVPDWPADKTQQAAQLRGLRCFETLQLSAEDAARTKMYQQESERARAKSEHGTMDEWLTALGITVTVTSLEEVDVPRVVQLINKTNQMNLTTRRLTEPELKQWLEKTGAALWTVRVSDRYGDSGLVGVVSAMLDPDEADAVRIVDFLLSCRVFGRKIEDVMLGLAIGWAGNQRKAKVLATYLPTEKNSVCLDFWKNSGCDRDAAGTTFIWPVAKERALPASLTVAGDFPTTAKGMEAPVAKG
jgi:FkbH-like protein